MVREQLPRFLRPMLARSGMLTDPEGWAYEVKFDGMRAQVQLDRGELCLRSRPGRDCTEAFPELGPPPAGLRGRRLLPGLDPVGAPRSGDGRVPDPQMPRPRQP
jgi:ATP dependent DNA ligase domain